MNELPVLVDVDGVLANFCGHIVSYLRSRYPEEKFDFNEVTQDFRKIYAKFWDQEAEDYVNAPGFCQKLEMLPYAQETIEILREKCGKIVFVTTPYRTSQTWCFDRTEWLKKHFDARDDEVIFARDKKYVRGIIFIDDKPKNVVEWAHYNGRNSFLFGRPWNTKESVKEFKQEYEKDIQFKFGKLTDYPTGSDLNKLFIRRGVNSNRYYQIRRVDDWLHFQSLL